jgi:hypothetical protein
MAGLTSVGDFELSKAELITSSGLVVDLSSSIINITIFEDTTTTAVSGNIMLQDSFAVTSTGPIIGQEYLKLKIKTPSLTEKEHIIDFTENVFMVNSLESRINAGNNVQVYLLNFTSSEIVRNQRTKVSRSLKGSYSDIVKIMLGEIDCKKEVYLEPTSGSKRIVAPNVRPFDIIKMATREAVSQFFANSSYLFFETLKGYHFRSISSLYAQNPKQTYTTFVHGANIIPTGQKGSGSVDIEKELANVLDFEIVQNPNSLVNYTTGVFASNLIVHDIFNKSYKKFTYNIFDKFAKENHITGYHQRNKKEFPIYSHLVVDDKGNTVQDFPARTFVTPVSQNGTVDAYHTTENNTSPFSPPDAQNSLQSRTSQMIQLEQGLLLNILTHGNTIVSAGDIVKLDLPYNAALKTTKNEKNDRFYKGMFFVKRLRHDFDFGEKKHKTYMTLVKDSLEESLDGPEDNFEPKPKKSAVFHEELEDFYPNT